MSRSGVISSFCRSLATSSSKTEKTSVVFLHFGQPRTEYYAKDFLRKAAQDFYQVPNNLKGLISNKLMLNDTIRRCILDYENRPTLEDDVDRLASDVKEALVQLVPEYGNIDITSAFTYERENFLNNVESAISNGSSNVILFPLYSHNSCSQSGLVLNSAACHVYSSTVPAFVDQRTAPSLRVRPMSDIEFTISAVHRWSSHPFLADMWSTELMSRRNEFDAIVFAAPIMRGNGQKEYCSSVWASCERIADLMDHVVPWRLGFYNSWTDWALPIRDSVGRQVSRIAGKGSSGVQKRVAVVPVTEFMPTFNTFSVLPQLLEKKTNTVLLEPETDNRKTVQGLAEILKHHLLGRRNAQIREFCDTCLRKDCEKTRSILD